MALFVIATPIGNEQDITLRAIETLKSVDLVIGEERKVTSKLLKRLDIQGKPLYNLNEHSEQEDLEELFEFCKSQNVALVSDCGTPGFCDPGANLIALCRQEKITVHTLPGASSLMTFLGGCGVRLDKFIFQGFLPANKEAREKSLKSIAKINEAILLMDTPYRLTRLLEDLQIYFSQNGILIGLDMTSDNEEFLFGTPRVLLQKLRGQKREFMLAVLPRA